MEEGPRTTLPGAKVRAVESHLSRAISGRARDASLATTLLMSLTGRLVVPGRPTASRDKGSECAKASDGDPPAVPDGRIAREVDKAEYASRGPVYMFYISPRSPLRPAVAFTTLRFQFYW